LLVFELLIFIENSAIDWSLIISFKSHKFHNQNCDSGKTDQSNERKKDDKCQRCSTESGVCMQSFQCDCEIGIFQQSWVVSFHKNKRIDGWYVCVKNENFISQISIICTLVEGNKKITETYSIKSQLLTQVMFVTLDYSKKKQ
jgi:hypothetical protein